MKHPAAHHPNTALVGCAGWGLPRDLAAAFPADGSQLQRYAAVFGAVEINSSFYKPHLPATYARWGASVPAGFRFAVKLPKRITHELKLLQVDEALDQFAGAVAALGVKLGCVLVQLPPSLLFDAGAAGPFFRLLAKRFACQLACEARHASWFSGEASALMQARAVTRVQADPPKGQPGAFEPTTQARYIRLHGSPQVYYSSYTDAQLADLRQELAQPSHPSWLIFDNTASGAAQRNALAVRG